MQPHQEQDSRAYVSPAAAKQTGPNCFGTLRNRTLWMCCVVNFYWTDFMYRSSMRRTGRCLVHSRRCITEILNLLLLSVYLWELSPYDYLNVNAIQNFCRRSADSPLLLRNSANFIISGDHRLRDPCIILRNFFCLK